MSESESTGIAAAITYCVIHTVLWMGLLFLLTIVVPRYAQVLADFDAELPVVSRIVIQVGEAVSRYWYLFALLGAALTAVDFICLWKLGQAGGAMQSLAGLVLALLLLGLGSIAFLGAWIPFNNLLDALQ